MKWSRVILCNGSGGGWVRDTMRRWKCARTHPQIRTAFFSDFDLIKNRICVQDREKQLCMTACKRLRINPEDKSLKYHIKFGCAQTGRKTVPFSFAQVIGTLVKLPAWIRSLIWLLLRRAAAYLRQKSWTVKSVNAYTAGSVFVENLDRM